MKKYPLYQHANIPTLKELVAFCAREYGNKPAFQYSVRKTDFVIDYIQFKSEIEALGTYLLSCGYQNSHIAVYGENSYFWILTHFSVTCGRNVIVPIDKELSSEQIAALLKDSECVAIVYSDTYADVIHEIQSMELEIDYINMNTMPSLVHQGRELVRQGNRDFLDLDIGKADLASIVYTSGTTGKSKGVMLTHYNFCSCMRGACENVLLTGPSLLVLPLHHTFGLVASVFAVMFYGYPICINQSLKRLSQDLKKWSPQHLFVVPLMVEAVYKNIWTSAKKQGKDKLLKRMIVISSVLLRCGIDLRKRFFGTVLESLGGNLDLIVSGGAPLDEKYVKAFHSFGITILNGYGITECGPIVAVNRNAFFVSGSVGLPLCCNTVKISDEGEILVQGDNVMQGYYHNDKENEKAFDDGWFRTGDLGYLDEYGALHITGRIKNLIILSNGENVAAESIEQLVYSIPYVKEIIAYGKDDMIVAEVFLDDETADSQVRIYDDIKYINQKLPLAQNIGKIVIRETEFPKTTTKKIKRNYGGAYA